MQGTDRGAASWTRAEIEATRRPLDEASTLPGVSYHGADVFRDELQRIFGRMWLCAGHQDDLRDPGDYLARRVGHESVVLVRGEDGDVYAHFNVCRHRGSTLLADDEGGGLEHITCPYHGWKYGLDGRLSGAPLMETARGFSAGEYSLLPVRLDVWNGFLFINLDENAAPLVDQLADFPDIGRFRLQELRIGAQVTYDVEANWKLLCENYGECYHCALNHPQLHRISRSLRGGVGLSGSSYCGGPMELADGHSTMSMSATTSRPSIPGLDEEDLRLVHYFNIYPAFLLSLHPDYILTHTIWPRSADRSHVVCAWLFPGEAVASEGFDPSDAVEFWDLTNRQDWTLCESVQQSVRSRGFRPGRYQSSETSVHAFDNWYLRHMT